MLDAWIATRTFRVKRVFLWSLVAVGLAACSYQPEVYGAIVSGDGTSLDVELNNCGGDYSIEVNETSERVVVEITDNRTPLSLGGGDCADAIQVDLDDPLGDRQLLSGGGEEIDVTFYPWNQQKYSEAEYIEALEATTQCILDAEPDANVTMETHPDGYPDLRVEAKDQDSAPNAMVEAFVSCSDRHVEPLRR